MGSELEDESKERRHGFISLTGLAPSNKHKLKLLLVVLLTNLLTLFVSRSTFPASTVFDIPNNSEDHDRLVATLLRQLNDTTNQVADLQGQLSASDILSESLLQQLSRLNGNQLSLDSATTSELSQAVSPHKLPLGYSPKSDSDELFPSVGAGCFHYPKQTLKAASTK